MIELGVIRVVNQQKVVTIYKDKEIIGEISIKVNRPEVEEKILNLIKIIENKS